MKTQQQSILNLFLCPAYHRFLNAFSMRGLHLAGLFMFLILSVHSASGQESFCRTIHGSAGVIGSLPQNINPTFNGPYFFRVYVHVIQHSDGSGGQTSAEVETIIAGMNQDFNTCSEGIYFIPACDINYIKDDDLYLYGELCDFAQYSHTDGIDIFLMADDAASWGGRAELPGTAFVVGGTFHPWDGATPVSVAKSRTVSHEMGHCLGLYHTHHGTRYEEGEDCAGNIVADPNQCEEEVGGSNGTGISCGDYVEDTPADPGIAFRTTPPEACEWLFSVPGYNYDPNERLIMSYSRLECLLNFTIGQCERMYSIIEMTPALQACLIQPDFVNMKILTTSTWTTSNLPNNGDIFIAGDLIIESGATLTIEAGVTVHFAGLSKLIIKPNARLLLHGTLTGKDCTWQGIKVWGSNASQSQYVINGVRAQGRIDCYPGSIIENAKTGIELYGPTYELAGGQISCNGTTFSNCKIGVEFAHYQNFWPFATPSGQQGQPRNYSGSFTKTAFLTNNNYLHQSPFYTFVHLTGVNGVNFLGCSFTNLQTITGSEIVDWGYGIFANDAGFSVGAKCEGNPVPDPLPCESYTYSEFIGLGYGVYTSRIETNRPYTVKQANFKNCFVGIRNKGVTGGTLLFNNFNMGEFPSVVPTNDQVGVIFETAVAGFTCEENDFINVTGTTEINTIGTISINTGIANKTIRRNRFDKLAYGNLSNLQNASQLPQDGVRGLYYDCNRNFDVVEKDFSVPNGGIKVKQGLEIFDPNTGQVVHGAAGNRFSLTAVDFSNIGAPIEYFYNPLGQNQQPFTIEGNITLVPTFIENGCPVTYCEPPCRTQEEIASVKSDFYQQKEAYLAAKSSYTANPTDESARQMAYRQRMMDEDAYMVVIHELYDTLSFNADTLRIWVANLGSLEGDLWLAGERLSSGNAQAALSLLNGAINKYQLTGEEQTGIGNYQSILGLLNGKPFYELDASTLQSVKGYLDADGYAEGWAKSILTLYGEHFPAEYVKDGDRIEERFMEGEDSPNVVQQPEWIRVSPNPARDFVGFSVSLSGEVKEAVLRIFDVNGRQIQVQSGLAPAGSCIWQTEGHASGVYFYHLTANGKLLKSGKIILIK